MATRSLPPEVRPGERGATLLLLAVIVFVFLSASALFASSQITHSERVMAEYGKLQAMNAAEAGIFAAFDATSDMPVTLLSTDSPVVTYEAKLSTPSAPMWIDSTGSATVRNFTYQARARGFVNGGRIVQWEFE